MTINEQIRSIQDLSGNQETCRG